MSEKKKVNKTENIKEYRKQWERDKHSGKGLPACYTDLPKPPKTLVVKRGNFKVVFD